MGVDKSFYFCDVLNIAKFFNLKIIMKKFYILILLALLCSPLCVSAQEAAAQEKEQLDAQVDSLQQRLAKIEKRAKIWDKLKQHFKISGLLQAGYSWEESSSTFYLRRARLSLAGDIFRGKKGAMADYRLQVEFTSTPKIVDLYIRYAPVKEFGIQIGQFKSPLSIENSEYNPKILEFIDYSLVAQRLAHLSSGDVTGISSTGRELGAQFYGSAFHKKGYSILRYNLALFNGNGINAKDNNKTKDFVGRVMVSPIKDLTLAGYYQYGEGSFAQDKFPQFYGAEVGNTKYVKYQRYGGGVAYNGKHAFARAEYIGGKTGVLRSEGAYASAGYKFCGKGMVGVRFDYFDDDLSNIQREFNYTLGVTYQPWKYLRLQLNYVYKHYQHFDKKNGNLINFMVTAMY